MRNVGQRSSQPCRLIALGGLDEIVGWAALSQFSSRCVYAGVAQVSIYMPPNPVENAWEKATIVEAH